jgi:hypothetical protein
MPPGDRPVTLRSLFSIDTARNQFEQGCGFRILGYTAQIVNYQLLIVDTLSGICYASIIIKIPRGTNHRAGSIVFRTQLIELTSPL